jgi:hypothetical protein
VTQGMGKRKEAGTLVASLRYLRRTSPAAFTSALLVCGVWLILWAILWQAFCLSPVAVKWMQPWIETVNGATWPGSFGESWRPSSFWMAGAVATRTVLNLAGPLAVVGLVYWLCQGGLERVMAMNIVEVLSAENDELIARVTAYLDTVHPKMLTPEQRAFLEGLPADLIKAWGKAGELRHFEEAA